MLTGTAKSILVLDLQAGQRGVCCVSHERTVTGGVDPGEELRASAYLPLQRRMRSKGEKTAETDVPAGEVILDFVGRCRSD